MIGGLTTAAPTTFPTTDAEPELAVVEFGEAVVEHVVRPDGISEREVEPQGFVERRDVWSREHTHSCPHALDRD